MALTLTLEKLDCLGSLHTSKHYFLHLYIALGGPDSYLSG